MLFPKTSGGLEVAVGVAVIIFVLFAIAIAPVGVNKPEGEPFAVPLDGKYLVCDRFWDNQVVCSFKTKVPKGVSLVE